MRPSIFSQFTIVGTGKEQDSSYLQIARDCLRQLEEEIEDEVMIEKSATTLNRVRSAAEYFLIREGISFSSAELFMVMMHVMIRILMRKHREETIRHDQLTIALEELNDSADYIKSLREELDGMKPVF